MKNILSCLALFVFCIGCKSGSRVYESAFEDVEIDTVLTQKMSVRAIVIDKDKLWYACDKSRIGFCNFKTNEKAEIELSVDSPTLEFRSIAQTSSFIFVANIGSPAYIYKINKADLSYEKVYTETNEKAFYDSMNFWNDQEGIAVGDPTEDCLSVLITRDGGKTWKKTPCETLPKTVEGEAAFAASNTNICIKGNKTWVVSGGKKSRVFYASDKGKTWKVYETPIIQGQAMTGIFSADFYDKKTGFVVGGNYEITRQAAKNKALTLDGGKTWEIKADGMPFGYASCVQFVPDPEWKALVAVGPSGIYYSYNNGDHWQRMDDYFSPQLNLHTLRFLDKKTAYAAGKDIIVKLSFKNLTVTVKK